MYNYKLKIQYKGTNYAGWQIQKNAMTVQQKITDAIQTITRNEVNLIGSGRTDTGVHALGQVANFRSEKEIKAYEFLYALNSILPKDISVLSMQEVDEDFHARYDARKRSYVYLFVKNKSPFFGEYAFRTNWINDDFIAAANKMSKKIIGSYDFTSFSRKAGETKTNDCEVFNIHWKNSKQLVYFYIEANRFLHGMVRAITGTILDSVRNNEDEEKLLRIIELKDREKAGMSVPAHGLFLYKVKY